MVSRPVDSIVLLCPFASARRQGVLGRKRHASSSTAILPTTSSPLPCAKEQAHLSSPHPQFCFLPSVVKMILPRFTGLQKSLLPAPWRNHRQPLLSTAKLPLVWGGMAWEGAGETGEAGEGGAGSQGDLPGRGTVAALDPAGAKLPGKRGRLRGNKEAQDGHSAEDPDLQVFIPASCIAQQSVVLAQLLFLWCMDGAWLSTLFPSGHDMVNFVAFPILCVSSYH